MKAYKVWDDKGDGTSIVFAENIKEAKKIAIHTDVCEEADFIDIRVKRYECADVLYKGKSEIDWYDMETRLTLVRDFGWDCFEPSDECENCIAKKYCHWHASEEQEVER